MTYESVLQKEAKKEAKQLAERYNIVYLAFLVDELSKYLKRRFR